MKLAGLRKGIKNGERAYHTQSREQGRFESQGKI
jgi:hypothetical protein